jgi:creatinine amidohydrolase
LSGTNPSPPPAGDRAGGRPYVLEETNWRAVRDTAYELAVLPWGATEAHNRHLPYGTDTLETRWVAEEAARLAWEAGARVVVLPAVPFGVQTGMLDIPLCLNLNPSTQAAVLQDLAHSLSVQGIPRLLILNGHGGNHFRQMIRELQPRVDVFLCVCHWYHAVDPRRYFEAPGDHAGELETSVMQHIAPEWVLPLSEAGAGRERRFRIEGLREGWVWAPRRWSEISSDTGVGDPGAASPEKGVRYLTAVTARLGTFLVELAAAAPEDLYEPEDG